MFRARQPAAPAPELGVIDRDGGTAGHERPIDARLGRDLQIRLVQRIGNGIADPLGLQLGGMAGGGRRPLGQDRMRQQPDPGRRLLLQHLDQIGLAHRRQRIEALRRIGDQDVAGEEMALIDGAVHLGKGGGEQREARGAAPGQEIGAGADIAPRRGIEGGAVFVEDLAHAPLLQGIHRAGKGRDGALGRDDPGLEAEDHRLQPVQRALAPGPEQDRAAHAAAADQRGQLQRPGQIIGDGPEHQRCRHSPRSSPLCALTKAAIRYMIYPI